MGFDSGSDVPRDWDPPPDLRPIYPQVLPVSVTRIGLGACEPVNPQAYEGYDLHELPCRTDAPRDAGDPPPSPRDSWMGEEIEISILGVGAAQASSYAAIFGKVDRVTFQNSFCVVIGDDGRLECQNVHQYDSITFDADLMRAEMGLLASCALDRLRDNPSSVLWNAVFRYSLAAAEQPQEFTAATTPDGPMYVATIGCDNVAVGDHARADVSVRYGGDAQASLATLVKRDPALARSVALALDNPAAAVSLRRDIETRVAESAQDLPIEALLGAIQAADNNATVTVAGTRMSATGVVAALVGSDTSATHTATLITDEVAVTGVWASNETSTVAQFQWQHHLWYLLDDQNNKPRG